MRIGLLGAGLALVAATGCTTTINGDDAAPISFDDGGPTEDTGTVADTSTPVGDTSTNVDAGCEFILDFGSADCSQCVADSCQNEELVCNLPDDGGQPVGCDMPDAADIPTACTDNLSCVLDDIHPSADSGLDGESPSQALVTCSSPSTTAAVVNCAVAHCATQCDFSPDGG